MTKPLVCALCAAVVAAVASGCGGDTPPQLLDGREAPPLPAALGELDGAVGTFVDVSRIGDAAGRRLRTCKGLSEPVDPETTVVERVGPVGASVTLVHGSTLRACDEVPDKQRDESLLKETPWCGTSAGRLRAGELVDPRLFICMRTRGEPVAFAWIVPPARVRWLVIRDGEKRYVFERTRGLPIRVTTASDVRMTESASFDVEEYAADGSRLREYTLDAQVAG